MICIGELHAESVRSGRSALHHHKPVSGGGAPFPTQTRAKAIKVVIERRHQNGRWPLNLLHPEHIPLQMETHVGSASRWNTLRALRVLRWYNNVTR